LTPAERKSQDSPEREVSLWEKTNYEQSTDLNEPLFRDDTREEGGDAKGGKNGEVLAAAGGAQSRRKPGAKRGLRSSKRLGKNGKY